MKNTTKKLGGWNTVRQQLATWEKPALLALLKDLYEGAGVNRDFIHARSKTGDPGGEVLEKYRSKIVEQFFPARGDGKLKLEEARKAIRDYRFDNHPRFSYIEQRFSPVAGQSFLDQGKSNSSETLLRQGGWRTILAALPHLEGRRRGRIILRRRAFPAGPLMGRKE